jgi:DNA invertase Pin-like site-specific DNA recombinase
VTARGWAVTATYQEVACSGAHARRPGLDQLLHDARSRRFQVVLVSDLSHLARGPLHALELLRELDQLKVRLIAVKQGFDTGSAAGKACVAFAATLAGLERSLQSERARIAVARARAQGGRVGRPPRLVDLTQLRRMREDGLSLREIARRTATPCATVARRLQSVGQGSLPQHPRASRPRACAREGPAPGGCDDP